MAYSSLSNRISGYLARELNLTEEKKIILSYGMENVYYTILGFVLIMAGGTLLGVPLETFFAALSGGLLRKVSGGFHFSTPILCLATGAITYPLLGWLMHWFFNQGSNVISHMEFILLLGAVSFSIVYLWAPVDSAAKPIVSGEFKRKLHGASLLVVVFFVILALLNKGTSLSTAIMGGLTLQSLTLLPLLKAKKKGGAER